MLSPSIADNGNSGPDNSQVAGDDAQQAPQIGDGSVIVRFENPSDRVLRIHHILPDRSGAPLVAEVDSGFFIDIPAQAGAEIGIADDTGWVGETYQVTGVAPEVVSLPVQSDGQITNDGADQEGGAVSQAPRIGDGSVIVRFENPSDRVLRIHHILPDRSSAPLVAEVDSGFFIDIPAQAGAEIGIADDTGWVGETYQVTGIAPEVVSLPVAAARQNADGTAEQPPQIGDGSAVVRLENPTPTTLFIHYILDDGSDAPLVAEIASGSALDIRAQAGAIIGVSDGNDWTGGQYVVNGSGSETLSLPLPVSQVALAGQVGNGSILVNIANPANEAMGVYIVPPDGVESQLVAAIEPGETLVLPAQSGYQIGFSPGGDWYGGLYTIGSAANQSISLPLQKSFRAGNGAIASSITNSGAVELGIYRIADGQSEAVGSVTSGETVRLDADPGMIFAFSPGGPYVGGNLTISQTSGQSFQVPLPLRTGNGQFTVRVANQSGRSLAVLALSHDVSQPPEFLGTLPAGGSVDVLAGAGNKIGFSDENGLIVGGSYTVLAQNGQQISAPLPLIYGETNGAVTTRITNTSGEPLEISVVDSSSASVIGGVAAGETIVFQSPPCTMLGFSSPETREWVGGMFQTSRDAQQSVRAPTGADSDPGKCMLLTNAQLQAVMAKIAVENVRLAEEEKSKTRFCWKATYGRGVGTVPRNCPPGQSEDTAGLCYDNCKPGYKPFVTMCIPNACPAGFTDTGLHCLKPAPVERAAFPWKLGDTPFSLDDARARCRKSSYGKKYGCGTYNSNTIVYSKCPSGYKTAPLLTNLCTPVCPPSMIDIGVSCQKVTYDRGVGNLMSCSGGKERDAGLCYDKCEAGYTGVGPVCWNSCPAKLPVNCGAACAASSNDCALTVTDQVTGPIMTAASVALIAVTAGAASGATAAANSAKTAATTAGKAGGQLAAKSTSRVAAQAAFRQQVVAALSKAATNAATKAVVKDLTLDIALSAVISGAIYADYSAEAKAAMRQQVRDAFDGSYTVGGEIDPKVIDAAVAAAIEGAEQSNPAEDFPWTSLDPTGVADIVVAYNHPICSDVK
ncbi:hypothetical protein O4H62_20580 [Hoeflea alexandrii]|nr:hypothetical protein [Hoeflea alexandrii]